MLLPPDILWQHRLRRSSSVLCYVVATIAVLVLAGWQFDLDLLKAVVPSKTAMNPVTAVALIFVSIAFLWRSSEKSSATKKQISLLLSTIALSVGLLKLICFSLQSSFTPDALLFPEKLSSHTYNGLPNRMSPNTAICLCLTALSVIILKYETKKTKRVPAHYISAVVALLSMMSLLGYLYQVPVFMGVFSSVEMAIHTAICFFLLSLAIPFANPSGSIMNELTSSLSGSISARMLLPAAIIIPALLGLLRLWGYWSGYYNTEFGVVLFSLFVIMIFVSLIWYTTRSINRRELNRLHTERALQASEAQVRAIIESAPDGVVLMDKEGTILKWNPQAQRLFRWSSEEMIGGKMEDLISLPENYIEPEASALIFEGKRVNLSKTIDVIGKKKDNSRVDISLSIAALHLHSEEFFICFLRDITERKQLEQRTLKFNEELEKQVKGKTEELTDMFERITDGFVALDKDFKFLYVNKKSAELSQKDPKEMLGRNIWEVFPDTINGETAHALRKAMAKQEHVSVNDYYAPYDFWQENQIYPSPTGLSLFVRDVSEKKRAEKNIVEAKELADKLIDSLPGVFYFYDQNGKFIRWNKQFEAVTGYTSEEIANMHPAQFFPAAEQEYITGRIMGVFEKGMNDAEAHLLTKDGKEIFYYFKAALVHYEGQPCLLGNGIDITERKKAEESLKASEKKYRILFDENPIAMWMLSLPEYKVTGVNIAALQQYGYNRDEFLAIDIFTLIPVDDINVLKANTNRDFRGMHRAGVWEHVRKDKKHIFVDVVTDDITFEQQPVRLISAHDVTNQHLSEEKLKEAYEATRKLTEHIQNIREEERLHIAREIHDELGQLLTVLKMDVSWLGKKIEPTTPPIQEKISELLRLIDTTVKTVRRIASELRPSLIDDLGLMAAMEWHLEEFEKRSGIFKEIYLPSNELELPDALKIGLFRIFQESLTNVARHSGASKVNVELKEINQTLELTIVDDGKGFDEAKANKKTLGLLGMKERTRMMGGHYSISGMPGEGTMVKVVVPLPNKDQQN